MPKTNGLTPKQQAFCLEYLKDLNGTQAAIRAGYSKRTAQEISSENLCKPMINDEITRLTKARLGRTEITADKVLSDIHGFAKFDIGQIYDKSGQLLPIHQMPEEARRTFQSLEVMESEAYVNGSPVPVMTKKVKFPDRLKAYELLGKHLKLFGDDKNVQVNVNVTLAQIRQELLGMESKPDAIDVAS